MVGTFQKMAPVLQSSDDRQHFLVVDLVVPFHCTEAFGIVSDRVPLVILWRLLRQDCSSGKVGAVSFDFATGAILSQQSPEDDKWHPVAYYSKSLSAVERNYEIHDKEMLAVIRALEDWRHFLEGAHHEVEIWMDHKNLEYFMSAKKLNRRQARWSLYLSRFNFTMHHRPGHSMGQSDALSRRADHGTRAGDNSNVTLLHLEFFATHAI